MSTWSGLAVELDGVRKAVRNLQGDADKIAGYVVERACAYFRPYHEVNAGLLLAEAMRALTEENAALRARVAAAGAIVEYTRGTQWCTTDGDCIRKEYAARCAPCRRKHDYRVALATWDATAPARGRADK